MVIYIYREGFKAVKRIKYLYISHPSKVVVKRTPLFRM